MDEKSFLHYLVHQAGVLSAVELELHLKQFQEKPVFAEPLTDEDLDATQPFDKRFEANQTDFLAPQSENETDIIEDLSEIETKTSSIDSITVVGETKAFGNTINDKEPLPGTPIALISNKLPERYVVLETLGEGGMGVVQRVQDSVLEREVALKRIKMPKQLFHLPKKQQVMLWRLKREASITAVLEHPNIVPLYDMQQENPESLYFTMQKIEGETLTEIIKRYKEEKEEFDENQFLEIFFKVCDGIAYAHSKGVIHRDLKPDNIMVGQFGEVYVMDWGIAKQLKDSNEINETLSHLPSDEDSEYKTIGGIGTPGYMPPEQAENANEVQVEADVFALGKILRQGYTFLSPMEELRYEMSTNRKKRKLANRNLKAKAHLDDFFSDKIPVDIQAIIEKATNNNMNLRYHSVSALAKDIERYQKNIRVSVRKYNLLEILLKWSQRNRKLIITISLMLLLCFTFLFYSYQQRKKQFSTALVKATNAQKTIKENKNYSKGEQIKILLDSLKFLNNALAIQPGRIVGEKAKWEVCATLIELACQTQDYQLADYIATDIQSLSILTNEKKKEIIAKVADEKTKTLTQHKDRLSFWIKELKKVRITKSMPEDAIFEISKMAEPEIFESLLELLKEATTYFLTENNRTARNDAYYQTIITALGRLENSEAGQPLIEALKAMQQKIAPLKIKPDNELKFMVALADALGNSKAAGMLKPFQKIRFKMGANQEFWNYTISAHRKLLALEKVKQVSTENATEYYDRGILKEQKGDLTGAIEDFTKAIELEPENPYYYERRGFSRHYDKDKNGAMEDYNKAIQLHPKFADAYNNRGHLRKNQQDLKGALLDYSKAIEIKPNFPFYYNHRGIIFSDLKEYDKAIKDYSTAIRLNPQFAKAYDNRGRSKYFKKQYKEALLDHSKAIEINSEYANAYLNRGLIKYILKDDDEALKDFDKAIQLSPRNPFPYTNRALIKKNKGNLAGALRDLDQAILLKPNFQGAYNNRANIKRDMKEYQAAIEDFTKALAVNQEDPGLFARRGDCYRRLKRYKESKKDLDLALQLNPNDSWTLVHQAELNYELKKIEEAIHFLTKAQQVNPRNYFAHFLKAKYCLALGKKREAIDALAKGIRLRKKDKQGKQLVALLLEQIEKNYYAKNYKLAETDIKRFKKLIHPKHPAHRQVDKIWKKIKK